MVTFHTHSVRLHTFVVLTQQLVMKGGGRTILCLTTPRHNAHALSLNAQLPGWQCNEKCLFAFHYREKGD